MARNMMIVALALISIALISTNTVNAQTGCTDIVTKLIPCESYLLGFASNPNPECCLSAQGLLQIANNSKAELRNVCECLKVAASTMPVSLSNAAQTLQCQHQHPHQPHHRLQFVVMDGLKFYKEGKRLYLENLGRISNVIEESLSEA